METSAKNKVTNCFGELNISLYKLKVGVAKTVYNTMVQPILYYCISVWGYAPCTYIRKIQRFQNRTARIISGNCNWEMSGLLIVKRLRWLNVTQRRDYFMGVLMHRCIYDNAPNYLKDLSIQVSHVQQRFT